MAAFRIFFLLFWRYFFSRRAGAIVRTISVLSFSGIALGIGALILITSVMNSLATSSKKRLLKLQPHLTVEMTKNEFKLPFDEIQKMIFVKNVFQLQTKDVVLKPLRGESVRLVAAEAFLYDSMGLAEHLKKINSQPETSEGFTLQTNPPQKGQVILAAILAEDLGIGTGSSLALSPLENLLWGSSSHSTFKVSSILQSYSHHLDGNRIYLSDKDKALFNSWEGESKKLWHIFLHDIHKSYEVRNLLSKRFENKNLQIKTWQELNSNIFFALKMEKVLLSLFLFLSIVVTCFSISIALTLLITQKQSDMGILLSLGLTPAQVKQLFFELGLSLASFGLLLGFVLGVGLSKILEFNPIAVLPDIYVDSLLSARLEWPLVGLFLSGAIVLAIISSYLPVRGLIRYKVPAEVLRASFRY